MEKQKVLLSGCNGTMGQLVCKAIKESNDFYVLNGFDKRATVNEFPVYSDINKISERPDIIIEFSKGGTLAIAEYAFYNRVPIVIGTTGLDFVTNDIIRDYANRIPVFQSANFSLGMCVFKNTVVREATQQPDVHIEIHEVHHSEKDDSPSGTAIMLADAINEALQNSKNRVYGRKGKREDNEIGISSTRGGTVPGVHTVYFLGNQEARKYEHITYSREVFAEGALKAARFLLTKKPGFYGMEDLLS